jgi:hypothetical protein
MKIEQPNRLVQVLKQLGLALFLLALAVSVTPRHTTQAQAQAVLDLGDAPDYEQGFPYPTYLYNLGASHVLGSGVYLGACVDGETNGQPTDFADGDDVNVGSPVYGICAHDSDEDGVTFLTPLQPEGVAEIAVVASAPCTLTAWIDFDTYGGWESNETLFPGGQWLSTGVNYLTFTVPTDIPVNEPTFARFRCTTDGAVAPTGEASDGEVEDYMVTVVDAQMDYGDAPDPTYPTLFSSSGASHVLGSDVYLGSCVDGEADGQPSPAADGDDLNAGSPVFGTCGAGGEEGGVAVAAGVDEDGVVFTTDLLAGQTAWISVTAHSSCTLSAWIDFGADGSWTQDEDDLFPNGVPLISGTQAIGFTVPQFIATGLSYARFRCTTDGKVRYAGTAQDGEVEDYLVRLGPPLDFGDAPDPDYPTLLTSGGAVHGLSDVYLGACVDAEYDGQPSLAANGDDVHSGSPTYGTCSGNDDEDGVTFATDLLVGEVAELRVVASAPCALTAWVDFNADGDWWDIGESLFPGGEPMVAGPNAVTFTVPAGAVEGPTYARFRCATEVVAEAAGPALDGEVEDYRVRIGPPLDLGDAPDPTYPTLLANRGASHVLGSGVYLGSCVDAELDGQPTFFADGDDVSVDSPVFGTCQDQDDEDGVTFTTNLLGGQTAGIDVVANADCTLTAWLDFNADGDWSDPGENLFPGGQALAAGLNSLSFSVPAGAVDGTTYARFRCTTDGAVASTGKASDGEVEDYQVSLGRPTDLGDAPDPTYPTLLASSGASHVLSRNVYLGSCVDAEPDGQPTGAADGDDANIGSPVYGSCARTTDEDGVSFATLPYVGGTANIVVNASAPCTLSAWVDFNADGDWLDADEALFPGGQALVAGLNPLSFAVPSSAAESATYARFRCTTDGAVAPTGEASDGEVEDYQVTIGPPMDLGDAPEQYPTLLTNAGARHALGSDVYLGSCVDAEADGQPTAAANGDDANASTPVSGTCQNGDDEDGVTFTSNLVAGQTAEVRVVASSACTLTAWLDFNADGDWSDTGESLFPGGQALVAGSNSLPFAVPAWAVKGATYARFRCTTAGPVAFTGQAPDGEVEDYVVNIDLSRDYGDAPGQYPTQLESTGAAHLLGSDTYLGTCVDAEADGQPTAAADGDDTNVGSQAFGNCGASGDEDGVIFRSVLLVGETADIEVLASAECTLSAWVDFNADGDWSDTGESLFPGGQSLAPGVNALSFTVPAGAAGGPTYARFRCTTAGAVSFSGEAPDGEVEDYRVGILVPRIYLPVILKR